jgi:hypothetical protein
VVMHKRSARSLGFGNIDVDFQYLVYSFVAQAPRAVAKLIGCRGK